MSHALLLSAFRLSSSATLSFLSVLNVSSQCPQSLSSLMYPHGLSPPQCKSTKFMFNAFSQCLSSMSLVPLPVSFKFLNASPLKRSSGKGDGQRGYVLGTQRRCTRGGTWDIDGKRTDGGEERKWGALSRGIWDTQGKQ
jgi:hypothetical protein